MTAFWKCVIKFPPVIQHSEYMTQLSPICTPVTLKYCSNETHKIFSQICYLLYLSHSGYAIDLA